MGYLLRLHWSFGLVRSCQPFVCLLSQWRPPTVPWHLQVVDTGREYLDQGRRMLVATVTPLP